MANTKVNAAATQKGELHRNSVSVLGIFGPQEKLRALVRLSSGRIKEVERGDRLASGEIVAIDKDGVLLRQSGRTKRIDIPGS